ncbi:MAG: sulfite reductase [Firmicutes bacterium]|nr:sulfite reductase [Bacillota bacterium]
MPVKFLTADKLQIFIDRLLASSTVFSPSKQPGNVIRYTQASKPEDICIDYVNSDISPKELFFPQTEELFSFDQTDEGIDLRAQTGYKPKVIFGMRACDVKALLTLDPVFNSQWPDPHYAKNRNETIIICLACDKALPTCFCNTFGIDPVAPEGADLVLISYGSGYIIEECSYTGRELRELYQDLLTQEYVHLEKIKEEKRKQLNEQFVHHVSPSKAKETMNNNFELPYWDEISRKCLGCGICTYVCPTCHCFDIFDYAPEETTGSRCRCWDSCMYGDFTKMAGGHNPRPTKKERVRNRFMHKIKYHLDRYGIEGCVGCGRCIVKCPVNMDITGIITDLGEVK